MKIVNNKTATIILAGVLIMSCQSKKEVIDQEPTLKSAFKQDFFIGTALSEDQINEKDSVVNNLIKSQFSAISPENNLKCERIHPKWDEYTFDVADKYVAYGKKNNMFVVGHALVWHEQLSPFVHAIKSKDSLSLFMKNHINTVAGRYKGKIDGWDVVNEALNEDGTYRKSIFLDKLGEDYLVTAFKLAEKAAPGTELYYNDFNIEQPKKREGAVRLLKKIIDSGARIDGVGIQGHWSLDGLPLKDIEESIVAYSKLGLKVMITELDISVLPVPEKLVGANVDQNFEEDAKMNPYTQGVPDSIQVQLAQRYEDLFKVFLKHQDKISRVTFWGVNDSQSWLNNWPIKNRTNYPLFFDRNNKTKKAYDQVMALKNKKTNN
ncbi:MAG: endo-1,4-beta-xylanase [Bacteroidetes bacterium]|nr:endo-1,4-beta-xylanase [Bacteroidota bacterium]